MNFSEKCSPAWNGRYLRRKTFAARSVHKNYPKRLVGKINYSRIDDAVRTCLVENYSKQ